MSGFAQIGAEVHIISEGRIAQAQQEGKTLDTQIQDGIAMLAEEGQIRQLASVLIDNAIKYCDDKSRIEVALLKKGRGSIRPAG